MAQQQTLGEMVTDSSEYKALVAGDAEKIEFMVDAQMPYALFSGMTQHRSNVLDLIPFIRTTQDKVKFDSEVPVKNEAGLFDGGTTTDKSAELCRRGMFIQVAKSALNDLLDIQSRINGGMSTQLSRRIQSDVFGGPVPAGVEYVHLPEDVDPPMVGVRDIPLDSINTLDATEGQPEGGFVEPLQMLERAVEMVKHEGDAQADAVAMNSQTLAWIKSDTAKISGTPVMVCNALPKEVVVLGDFANHTAIRYNHIRVRIAPVPDIGRYNIFVDLKFTFYVRRPLAFCVVNLGYVG